MSATHSHFFGGITAGGLATLRRPAIGSGGNPATIESLNWQSTCNPILDNTLGRDGTRP